MKRLLVIVLVFFLSLLIGCRALEQPDPYESDDFSRFFSSEKVDTKLALYSTFSAGKQNSFNDYYSTFYYEGISYLSNEERCKQNKGLFQIDGKKLCELKNYELIKSFFMQETLNIAFLGDTLGLKSIPPFQFETVKPFSMFTISDTHLKKEESLSLAWNNFNGEKQSMALMIRCDDIFLPDSVRNRNIWQKIIDDNGTYTVPPIVFERLHPGRYQISLIRANNEVKNFRKPVQVLMVASTDNYFSLDK